MRILVAIDSLKGSLSSLEAGLAIKEGLEEIDCEVVVKPIADGGEGSVEAMADALGAKLKIRLVLKFWRDMHLKMILPYLRCQVLQVLH